MARFVDENSENHPQESSAPSDSTAVSADVSAAEVSAGAPSPLPEANAGLPAHLQDLTDRARTYVEAASSANTRRAYVSSARLSSLETLVCLTPVAAETSSCVLPASARNSRRFCAVTSSSARLATARRSSSGSVCISCRDHPCFFSNPLKCSSYRLSARSISRL